MANPFQVAGADKTKPTPYAPILTNRFFTGLWTQRSPLRDAATPFLYEKFYSASRYESLIGGSNVEVTNRLTLKRRPGHSVYNGFSFPPINRGYEFRTINGAGQQAIRVMLDSTSTIYDGTPPAPPSSQVATSIISVSNPNSIDPTAVLAEVEDTDGFNVGQSITVTGAGVYDGVFRLVAVTPAFGTLAWADASLSDPEAPVTTGTVTGGAESGELEIFTKSAGSTATQFQGVGNTLYFGDGVDQKKWLYPAGWTPSTVYSVGQFILDSNGNLQQATSIELSSFNQVTIAANVLTLRRSTPWSLAQELNLPGQTVTLGQFVGAAFLNGQPIVITSVQNVGSTYTLTAAFVHANYGPTADSGGMYQNTGSAESGGTPPISWGSSLGAQTYDGALIWTNKGNAVQNWGGAGPTAAPTVANTTGTASNPAWAANTFYSPILALLDSNSNIQLLTTAGTTGGSAPAWNVTTGATTADGSAVWNNQGASAWPANTAVVAGRFIAAFWTQTFSEPGVFNPRTGQYGPPTYFTVNFFDFFECVQAGTTGASQPAWNSGFGTQVTDNTAVWKNVGSVVTWAGGTLHSVATVPVGATTAVTLTQTILDGNGNLQSVYRPGKSGAAAPTWSKTTGALTNDGGGGLSWDCGGAATSTANAGAWLYGYCFHNSLTEYDTQMSPESNPIVLSPPLGFNGFITVGGYCSTDVQFDTVRVFRTPQQVNTTAAPVFEWLTDIVLTPAQIGNGDATWSFADTIPDASLNFEILGDTTGQNAGPPVGFLPDCYHLERIWGHVGNVIWFTNGPDALNGVGGNESMAGTNNYVMPSPVTRIVANALGLFVLSTAGMFTIPGSGTASDPLQSPKPFLDGKTAGLLSYDALDVNGTLLYMMNSKSEALMIDPSSGVTEVGFPIGDILLGLPDYSEGGYGEGGYGEGGYGGGYSPATTRVVWHDQNSTDAALYVADGQTGWYRCNPTPAPETGMCWSPQAQIAGGAGWVQSMEVATGVHLLLVQAPAGGPLLFRDPTTFADAGTTYAARAIVGSLVLAHAGSVALVDFLATDAIAIAGSTRITPSVLLDEISGVFEALSGNVPDPTYLPASQSLYGDRWYLSMTQEPALCRHLQIQFTWANENYGSELLAYTMFGAIVPEL